MKKYFERLKDTKKEVNMYMIYDENFEEIGKERVNYTNKLKGLQEVRKKVDNFTRLFYNVKDLGNGFFLLTDKEIPNSALASACKSVKPKKWK